MSAYITPNPTVASPVLNELMVVGTTKEHNKTTAPLDTKAMGFQP